MAMRSAKTAAPERLLKVSTRAMSSPEPPPVVDEATLIRPWLSRVVALSAIASLASRLALAALCRRALAESRSEPASSVPVLLMSLVANF